VTLLALLLLGLTISLWPSGSSGLSGPPGAPRRRSIGSGGSPVGWWTSVVLAFRDRGPAGRRDLASLDEVADALVLVGLALRAGLPLVEGLHHIQSESTGRVRAELAAAVAALRWGRPAREAWSYAGPRWRPAALATHVSEQTGAAPAALIERASGRLREEREREREQAAARAGVLLVLPLGLGFLPAFACTAVVPVVLNLASGVLAGSA
jgi:Flp pilus assembly protein TadB